jgi:hypothetical protein
MLNYGCEVWGMNADLKIIERVHLFALKRFLNVSIRTPNVLVYGETGRYPLAVNIKLKCIKYWFRILNMTDDRLPKKAYKMLLPLLEDKRHTWVSSIRYLLYRHGFNEVWENQGVGNVNVFLRTFKERLIVCYKHEWLADLNTKPRYQLYRTFKTDLTVSSYLFDLKHVASRNFLIRLRLGVLLLLLL